MHTLQFQVQIRDVKMVTGTSVNQFPTGNRFSEPITGYSLVTVTEFPPPPRWLAITEPTLPLRWFTVFSTVFLGTVS